MARYQITLAYDGTDFLGFQRQGEGRTVQSEVEAALRRLGWQGETLLAAGRTDRGVHAAGQVIAFDLPDWNHGPETLAHALNAHLPADVAVRAADTAADDFHPRYDARVRTYRYAVFNDGVRNPLLERYAWRIWPEANLQRLQAAANCLPGVHDFAAFGAAHKPGGSTVRVVYRAEWNAQASGLLFEVSANAYLYHMVRRLVYLQVLVGQGQLELEQFQLAVQAAQPQTPGLAPPNGLVLAEVRYELNRQESQVLVGADDLLRDWSDSGDDDSGENLRHKR
jgi:tRNA pseudouridine38-40 synthase